MTEGRALLLSGAKSGTSPLPDAVAGLELTGRPDASHGERPPTAGDAGGVPLSLSKFSNLERNDDTGLIEEASGPSFEPSMLTAHVLYSSMSSRLAHAEKLSVQRPMGM